MWLRPFRVSRRKFQLQSFPNMQTPSPRLASTACRHLPAWCFAMVFKRLGWRTPHCWLSLSPPALIPLLIVAPANFKVNRCFCCSGRGRSYDTHAHLLINTVINVLSLSGLPSLISWATAVRQEEGGWDSSSSSSARPWPVCQPLRPEVFYPGLLNSKHGIYPSLNKTCVVAWPCKFEWNEVLS